MEYTLRPLCSKDVFPMFKIISAIGLREFKDCFNSENVREAAKKVGENPDYSSVGFGIFVDIAGIIVTNIPKCENEIYTFLANISNLTRKQIEEMGIADFAQMIIDIIQKPEFKDFIGVVSKLFK